MQRTLLAVGLLMALAPGLAGRAEAQPRLIAIASFGEHPVLREAVEGFVETVKAAGYVEGRDVAFDYQHVAFDRGLIPQLLAGAQAKRPALILSLTTGVTQATLRAVQDRSIPIVFAAVVDPVAAGIVPSLARGTATHAGASMRPNFDLSLGFLRQLLPDAQRVGVLFDPADDSDKANLGLLNAAARKAGLEIVAVGVEQQADLPLHVHSLRGRADALFLIQSNMVQTGVPVVAQIAAQMKLPAVNSVYSPDLKDQFAGFHAISYRTNGEQAGKIAVRILKGEKPQNIGVHVPGPADFQAWVSPKGLAALGREVPAALKDCKCFVPE